MLHPNLNAKAHFREGMMDETSADFMMTSSPTSAFTKFETQFGEVSLVSSTTQGRFRDLNRLSCHRAWLPLP